MNEARLSLLFRELPEVVVLATIDALEACCYERDGRLIVDPVAVRAVARCYCQPAGSPNRLSEPSTAGGSV